jgi:hypothetical protein
MPMDNTEIIRNCNKEELMEIINAARDNLNDYKQSTDSEILQALINGDIRIIHDFTGAVITGPTGAVTGPISPMVWAGLAVGIQSCCNYYFRRVHSLPALSRSFHP